MRIEILRFFTNTGLILLHYRYKLFIIRVSPPFLHGLMVFSTMGTFTYHSMRATLFSHAPSPKRPVPPQRPRTQSNTMDLQIRTA